MLKPVDSIQLIFFTSLSLEKSSELILSCFRNMQAKVKINSANNLVASLGSGIKTRLIGLLIGGIEIYPRDIIISTIKENEKSKITIKVKDTFGFGLRAGFSEKIEKLLYSDGLKIKDSFPK